MTPGRWWGLLALMGIVLLAVVSAVYWPSMGGPFVYDDLAEIVTNTDLHDLADPRRIVAYNPARALLLLSFAVEWHLWGNNPLPFHVTNVLIHFMNACLVGALAWRLQRADAPPGPADLSRLFPSFAAALLFASHPLFVESVSYIASRSSSLCALFYIASLLSFSQVRDIGVRGTGAARGLWYALTLLFMLLAVATKEIAATLPAALLLFDLTLSPRDAAGERQSPLPHVLPWLLLLAMFGARLALFGSLTPGAPVRTVAQNLYTESAVVVGYLYRFVVPYPLSIYHDVLTVTDPLNVATTLSTLLHISLICWGIWLWRRRSPLAFVVLFFYLTLTPSSSFIPLKEAMAEHRAYLPGMGLLAGIGWGLGQLRAPPWRAMSRWAALVVIAGFAGLTMGYSRVWGDELSLWRHATDLAPHSGDAFYAYGDALRRKEQLNEAAQAYTTAIANYEARGLHHKTANSTKIVYNYPDALNNLGLVYAMQGDVDRAIAQFRIAARAYPSLGGQAWTNLGYALILKGQLPSAETALLKAVDAEPNNVLAHLHLANLYYAYLNNRQRALEHYKAVLSLDPAIQGRDALEQRVVELSY